jgi:hypothetical protein
MISGELHFSLLQVVWDQEDSYDSIRRDQQRLLDEQCIRSFRVITHLSLATASPAGRQALLEYEFYQIIFGSFSFFGTGTTLSSEKSAK